MKALRWIKYILKCVTAIGDGIEVVINRWPGASDHPDSVPGVKKEAPMAVPGTEKSVPETTPLHSSAE